jgi:hypothetical protein
MEINMHGPQATDVHVTCAVCRHELPSSRAMPFEASDYVAHFCGPDCLQRWLADSRTPGDDTF